MNRSDVIVKTGGIGTVKVRTSKEDAVFYFFVYLFLGTFMLLVIYPLIYILSASFSSTEAVLAGKVVLWPVDLSIEGYEALFRNDQILIGYRNTIFYTVAGTFINVIITLLAAYPMSRKNLPGKGIFMFIFTFTTIFSGGLIPTYILMKNLNFINTVWSMLIPGALSVFNMIITRTFIQSNIPLEMLEAAQIDGCNDFKYLILIVIPLSKAVIAVITLFYAVTHWNSFFNALLYIRKKQLYPLQLVLRDILIVNTVEGNMVYDYEELKIKQGLAELLKFSLIVVSSAPILCLYPFLQKYFVKGVMIGAIKG